MIYQRHSFKHNFLNAVETDSDLALDVIINEINELVLDNPKQVIAILHKNGIRVPKKPTAKDLAVLINEFVTTSEPLRKDLGMLITERHSSPYVNADGGKMDLDFAATGPDATKAPESRISLGIGKTFGVIENNFDTKVDVPGTKKLMIENLEFKMAQKGITDAKRSKVMKIVVISIVSVVVIAGVVYLIKKSKTQN